jgi:hypothetical protein
MNAGDHNAPKQLFNVTPDLPMPRVMLQQNQIQDSSARDAANKRKNWTLLTPEEIMGVKTAEQILGVKDPNKDKESKLSLEEQFLLRNLRDSAGTATNGRAGAALLPQENSLFSGQNRNDQLPFSRLTDSQANDRFPGDSARYFNDPYKTELRNNVNQQATTWKSAFSQPAQPRQTPEQLENLERFRAMMEAASTPEPANKSFNVRTAPAPAPSLKTLPVVNPAGRSVAAIDDNISRPTGIQPLPTATGSTLTKPKTRPSSHAQRPPWMSDAPQPHSINRGF